MKKKQDVVLNLFVEVLTKGKISMNLGVPTFVFTTYYVHTYLKIVATVRCIHQILHQIVSFFFYFQTEKRKNRLYVQS